MKEHDSEISIIHAPVKGFNNELTSNSFVLDQDNRSIKSKDHLP